MAEHSSRAPMKITGCLALLMTYEIAITEQYEDLSYLPVNSFGSAKIDCECGVTVCI